MWMYGDTLARLERLAPGVLHNDLKACNDYAAGLESAAKVKCPALFILGRRDVMTPPRAAQALQEKIAGAKTVTLDASGHSLMAEAPDATLDALIGLYFLNAERSIGAASNAPSSPTSGKPRPAPALQPP